VLQDGCCRGKHHVGRGGGDDDEVDIPSIQGRSVQSLTTCLQSQVAGVGAIGDEVPSADTGALHDPIVAGLDTASSQHRHHVGIAQPPGWQATACTGDAGVTCHSGKIEKIKGSECF
jgi:hypothetical protein